MESTGEKGEKIVIQPQELPPAAKRVVIAPEELAGPAAPASQSAVSSRKAHNPPVAEQPRRKLLWAAAVALAVAILVTLVAGIALRREPSAGWIERLAKAAEKSVVVIQSGERLGTGFVVAAGRGRCLIATNRHVIEDPSACVVLGRSLATCSGRVVAFPRDDDLDLAMLLVESDTLEPLGPIAPFESVQTGQAVVAIGHPRGLDYTVTEGIVSAKRAGVVLQTSAAINLGNSGGPLVNQEGRIVGVNTLTVDPRLGYGLGFAIRADLLRNEAAWRFDGDIADLLQLLQP